MKGAKKDKFKFIWQLLSIFFAVVLWFVIIQIENPDDTYTVRNIEISPLNAEALDTQNLIFYGFGQDHVTVKFSGGKVTLGKLRQYEGDITATVDIKNYFTNNKLSTNEGVMLPVVINVPDKLKNVVKIDRQSVEYTKIEVDDKITEIKDVKLILTNSATDDYYVQEEKAKVLPQKVELIGAKALIEKVKHVRVDYNVTSGDIDNNAEAKVVLYDENDAVIEGIVTQPENVQIQVPIFKKKKVKLNLQVKNKLSDNFELEEVKIEPSELVVAADKKVFDLIEDVINIPMELEQKGGKYTKVKDVVLNDSLVNVDNVSKVNITYVIKEN